MSEPQKSKGEIERDLPRIEYTAMNNRNRPAWYVVHNQYKVSEFPTQKEAQTDAIARAYATGRCAGLEQARDHIFAAGNPKLAEEIEAIRLFEKGV